MFGRLPFLAFGLAAAVSTISGNPYRVQVPPYQQEFETNTRNWDIPPSSDSTAHLIFNTVSSLMKHWQNTRYMNGHTVVPGIIPIGTVLYHGRWDDLDIPPSPEWLAFDPEHSYIFASGGHMFTFTARRNLNIVYFDGWTHSLTDQSTESQDTLVSMKPGVGPGWGRERERAQRLCAWGKPFAIDGYVRTEFDNEVVWCNFEEGLEIISREKLLPTQNRGPILPKPLHDFVHLRLSHAEPAREGPLSLPTTLPPPHAVPPIIPTISFPPGIPPTIPTGIPLPPRRPTYPTPPAGWHGSLRSSVSLSLEANIAGSWHDYGESRVRLDYSRVATFYDPSLTSLVLARRFKPRLQHRVGWISETDAINFRKKFSDALQRKGSGSGVDWGALLGVVMDRYSDRMDFMRYLLQPQVAFVNTTLTASRVRNQVLVMLTPYMAVSTIPIDHSPRNTSWVAPIAKACSTTLTGHLPSHLFTPQEILIKSSIDEVLHEICRVLADVWLDAFYVEEEEDNEMVTQLIQKWRGDFEGLMAWLDWPAWVACDPACKIDAICYIPAWPLGKGNDPPRCVSRDDPLDMNRGTRRTTPLSTLFAAFTMLLSFVKAIRFSFL